MNLKDYLHENGKKITTFAADLQKPVSTVHGWIAGRRLPRATDLAAIERATDGKVTAKDFVQESAAA